MLMLLYPFMGGQKGCGGSSQFIEGEEAELQATEENGTNVVLAGGLQNAEPNVDEAIPPGSLPDASGAAKLVCPEPEPSPEPLCLRYLPAGADIYMMLDVEGVLGHMKDIEAVGAFKRIMDQVGAGVDALAREEKPEQFAERMKAVCFACVLSTEEVKAQKKTLMPADEGAGLPACEEMVFIDVFKEPFDFAAAIPPDEVVKSKAGTFLISDKLAAIQAAENVVVVGSKVIEKMQAASGAAFAGDLSEGERKLLSLASPSTLSIMSTNKGLKMFEGGSVLDLFKPAFKLVKFDYDSRVLAALNFSDQVSLSAAVYDIAKEKAGEKALVMKTYLQMPYDEFMFLVQQFADEGAFVKSGSGDIDALKGKLAQIDLEISQLNAYLTKVQGSLPYDAEEARMTEEKIFKLKQRAEELRRMIKELEST
jgi:hypothetical protein